MQAIAKANDVSNCYTLCIKDNTFNFISAFASTALCIHPNVS